jgi:hypothetical protein
VMGVCEHDQTTDVWNVIMKLIQNKFCICFEEALQREREREREREHTRQSICLEAGI